VCVTDEAFIKKLQEEKRVRKCSCGSLSRLSNKQKLNVRVNHLKFNHLGVKNIMARRLRNHAQDLLLTLVRTVSAQYVDNTVVTQVLYKFNVKTVWSGMILSVPQAPDKLPEPHVCVNCSVIFVCKNS